MLILLPPSEGKATSGTGPALDLDTLGFPELTPTRRKVLSTLQRVSGQRNALDILDLSVGQSAELERNLSLTTAATLPAGSLYTGVLYDHLRLDTLDPSAAEKSLLIFSGLWGVLRVTDRVPPYRLSMGVRFPRLGPLASVWRPVLARALATDELIIDLRSSTYAAAWNAGPDAVNTRVLREAGGRRTVVSHLAKATRGEVARALLASGASPRDPAELVGTLRELGFEAELVGSTLEIVEPES